jgi:hypothetical protein
MEFENSFMDTKEMYTVGPICRLDSEYDIAIGEPEVRVVNPLSRR